MKHFNLFKLVLPLSSSPVISFGLTVIQSASTVLEPHVISNLSERPGRRARLIAMHAISPRNMSPIPTSSELKPEINFGTSPSFASLPPELLVEIAEQLAASHSLGSLAAFSAVSQQLRTISHNILYRSLILVARDPDGFKEREKDVMIEEGMAIPEGWKFTK